MGGYGRLLEVTGGYGYGTVTGGYGRLREVTLREVTGGSWILRFYRFQRF